MENMGMDITVDEAAREVEAEREARMKELIRFDETVHLTENELAIKDEVVEKICNMAADDQIITIETVYSENPEEFYTGVIQTVLGDEKFLAIKDILEQMTSEEYEEFLSLAFECLEKKYSVFAFKLSKIERAYPEYYMWVLGRTHLTAPIVNPPDNADLKILETIKAFLGVEYDENLISVDAYKKLMQA